MQTLTASYRGSLGILTVPQGLLADTEVQLEKWKHPDIYIPPTAPGGMIFDGKLLEAISR